MQAKLHDAISNVKLQKPTNSRRQHNKNAEGFGGVGMLKASLYQEQAAAAVVVWETRKSTTQVQRVDVEVRNIRSSFRSFTVAKCK